MRPPIIINKFQNKNVFSLISRKNTDISGKEDKKKSQKVKKMHNLLGLWGPKWWGCDVVFVSYEAIGRQWRPHAQLFLKLQHFFVAMP